MRYLKPRDFTNLNCSVIRSRDNVLGSAESCTGDRISVTLKDRHAVDRLPEVPQSKRRVFAAGDNQPVRWVARCSSQFHVMSSKCLDHGLGGEVPQSSCSVPGRSDSLIASSHPVGRHHDPSVASEHHQGGHLPPFPDVVHLHLLIAPLLLTGMSKPSTLADGTSEAPHMCSPVSTACYH